MENLNFNVYPISNLLPILLKDKTTKLNIIWATTDYESIGIGYEECSEIIPELITGENNFIIQPRSAKDKNNQLIRTKKRAEVFTPSWICNEQNNQIDEAWFGRTNVFNTSNGTSWIANEDKIIFEGKKKSWQAYVNAKRLEMCIWSLSVSILLIYQ